MKYKNIKAKHAHPFVKIRMNKALTVQAAWWSGATLILAPTVDLAVKWYWYQ